MQLELVSHLRPEVVAALKQIPPKLKLCGPLRILFLSDGISFAPGVGFGLNLVKELLDQTTIGWVDFKVDTANHSPGMLNATLLNKYHQVWFFGIGGGNGSLSTDEQKALLKWMDERQGGVFATGDHDTLGAALGRNIPRAGTMRRWTVAQNVPSGGGPTRIDTNRPQNASQGAPTYNTIPNSAETDTTPQPIRWVAWMKIGGVFGWKSPHPILCHATHGPIDIMPDHPHEGRCFDTAPGKFEVDISSAKEYPTQNGNRPLPQVIAYGRPLPSPPYQFAKGEHDVNDWFPMISVYDGQQIGIGRVVVDSTWHHWMNLNIQDIKTAGEAVGASNEARAKWEKIRQYYINIARWLATTSQRRCMAKLLVLSSHFAYAGYQEFNPKASIAELGAALSAHLQPAMGLCWVRAFVLELVWELDRDLFEIVRREFLVETVPPSRRPPQPEPDPCLSCPSWEVFESHVLGGIVQASMKMIGPARRKLDEGDALKLDFTEAAEDKMLLEGARIGVAAFEAALNRDLKAMKPMLSALKGAIR